jgi:hypothetical protein
MTLWIQPLFGDPIEIPFSPPIVHWRTVYQYLQCRYFPDKRVHQLRLFRGESADLSCVEEGEILHLLVTDLMAERWVSEYSITTKDAPADTYHYSTVTWMDARWGDPYQDPSIQYRTPLMLHIVAREKEDRMDFMVMDSVGMDPYGGRRKDPDLPEHKWCSTLRWACDAFREGLNQEEEVCTESTIEHVCHLWELYHGTNQHVADQGRYYDY